jgi:hypothetical protein
MVDAPPPLPSRQIGDEPPPTTSRITCYDPVERRPRPAARCLRSAGLPAAVVGSDRLPVGDVFATVALSPCRRSPRTRPSRALGRRAHARPPPPRYRRRPPRGCQVAVIAHSLRGDHADAATLLRRQRSHRTLATLCRPRAREIASNADLGMISPLLGTRWCGPGWALVVGAATSATGCTAVAGQPARAAPSAPTEPSVIGLLPRPGRWSGCTWHSWWASSTCADPDEHRPVLEGSGLSPAAVQTRCSHKGVTGTADGHLGPFYNHRDAIAL